MSDQASAFAKAAQDCEGSAFRLYGRDPAFGLDCLGLVLYALGRAGCTVPAIQPYRLRNSDYGAVPAIAAHTGLIQCTGPIRCGDLICAVPGPGQLHFLIAVGQASFIHAHAGLRKVVRISAPLPWPVTAIFRLSEKE